MKKSLFKDLLSLGLEADLERLNPWWRGLPQPRLQEVIPLDEKGLEQPPHPRDLAGHIAESAVGYFFKSLTNLDVAHFPERGAEPEVDFVLTVGEQRIPIEVKYRSRITWQDTRGLRSFIEKSVYNAPFSVLVTQSEDVATDDPRIVSIPLASLLLMR
jgi:predicted AAA+ superfamily ATPase